MELNLKKSEAETEKSELDSKKSEVIDMERAEVVDTVQEIFDNTLRITYDYANELYNKGYEAGRHSIMNTGTWIYDRDESRDPLSRDGWTCSSCKYRQTYGRPNYCMHCGAEMVRNGEDD